jgi:DNA-binding transcriptional MerR regulator
MPTTSDELEAYKRGRAAIKNLAKDRNFNWWLDYSNAIVAVRTEAMRDAYTNKPVGKAYNTHYARIIEREKLDAFDANTRKDCVAMVDNLHHPIETHRGKGILAWRSELDISSRARLNHPSAILRRWKKDTEPPVAEIDENDENENDEGENEKPKTRSIDDVLAEAMERIWALEKEIKQLKAQIQELEEELRIARGTPTPKPEPKWTEADPELEEKVRAALEAPETKTKAP